jgi:hypothetical protein
MTARRPPYRTGLVFNGEGCGDTYETCAPGGTWERKMKELFDQNDDS